MIDLQLHLESEAVISEIKEDVRAIGREIITQVVEEFPTEARTLMLQSPATGKSYRRNGSIQIASSAGNPPRIQTGNLANTMRGRMKNERSGEVKMNWYGLFLDEKRNRKFVDLAIDRSMPRN